MEHGSCLVTGRQSDRVRKRLESVVYVMNGDGTQITTAFAGPFSNDTTRYFQPSWSPDGRKIAVVA
jgi:Tol biopolymer transport system component